MTKKEHIYGIDYIFPEPPAPAEVGNYHLRKRDQYFRHVEIPDYFGELDYDSDKKVVFTKKQWEWIETELDRIFKGYWFMNNGNLTYITGKYYYFLNYWTLENGDQPEYRDCDRRYYLFLDYCEKSHWILGILRIKSRREGATSQAASNLCYTATTTPQAKCGIVSKTGDDAKSVFTEMVVYGFRNLPIFLKPELAAGEDPAKLMRFMKQASRTKVKQQSTFKEAPEGLNSQIDWKNTKINSYDSKRNTRILVDESAKYPTEVPIEKYWGVVSKTLVKGASKVGFAELPTTVNAMKDGGRGAKLLWKESNHFEMERTPTGLVRYFKPAYDGLAGFIDRYGMSVIDAPTKEQESYLLTTTTLSREEIRMGAKEYLKKKIDSIKDDDMRREEKRMMPFTEEEAFAEDDSSCYFNTANIHEQLNYLADNPPPLRRVRFGWVDENTVSYVDDPNGKWLLLKQPKTPNMFSGDGGSKSPMNTAKYKIGVDPFASTIVVGKGSNGVAVVYETLDSLDPENTGLPVAVYIGRPKLKAMFHNEVLMAAHFFSCKATYENANDDYFEWFIGKGYRHYIAKTPKSVIDPNRKKKEGAPQTWGVSPKDPYSLNRQLELGQIWVDSYSHKMFFQVIFEDMLEYDHFNRTKSDVTVAFLVALTAAAGDVRNVSKERPQSKQYVQTYSVENVR